MGCVTPRWWRFGGLEPILGNDPMLGPMLMTSLPIEPTDAGNTIR